jgi:hypothetical protein
MLLYSQETSVKEQKIRYDNIIDCRINITTTSLFLPKYCTINMIIKQDLKLPIYFYYELTNFYQNNRNYITSYSKYQLFDQEQTNIQACEPLCYFKKKPLYPCGLIANSFFNDRFGISIENINFCPNCKISISTNWKKTWPTWHNDNGYWLRKNITWEVDLKKKFVKIIIDDRLVTRQGHLQQKQGLYLPQPTDPDFIVWSRISTLTYFRKLNRIIKKIPDSRIRITKGTKIKWLIANWFSVSEFKGSKKIIITTFSKFGGSNSILFQFYFLISFSSFLCFAYIYFNNKDKIN